MGSANNVRCQAIYLGCCTRTICRQIIIARVSPASLYYPFDPLSVASTWNKTTRPARSQALKAVLYARSLVSCVRQDADDPHCALQLFQWKIQRKYPHLFRSIDHLLQVSPSLFVPYLATSRMYHDRRPGGGICGNCTPHSQSWACPYLHGCIA